MGEDYEPVPLLDEEQQSEKSAWRRRLNLDSFYQTQPARKAAQHWVWIGHAVLLSISTTLFTLAFCMKYARPSDLLVTTEFSTYSPAASVVKYDTVRYNLTPIMSGSPYVGMTPAVDEAWEQISRVGDMMISLDEVKRLGLSPDSLKITDPKTGKVGYRAAIEVFHQLHCLNLIRQFTWKEFYANDGGDISAEPEDVRGHVDHCLETLRMNLMCQADIGVFTFKVYPELGDDDPWPEFSTLHTCRNFDGIRDWARSKAVTWDDNA
ncbi:hypothetical protein C8A00DRAFT_47145 [Chaetomidium leptoderma]|uniref:Cyclochlorotine biosynthesis protein O n=1 Tax=Chaetomidium leptoderma TaxID=669021 RepID=A0AAN6VCZ8_9PEZI|nr:hypothetical protein C8A00DRAFT_47145 [Chaetomidium leptoderma]